MSESVSEAAARLERAVDRLAESLARPRPAPGIPPEQVLNLAARLDNTLARLRGALAELDAAEAPPPAAELSALPEPGTLPGTEAAADGTAAAPPPTPDLDEER